AELAYHVVLSEGGKGGDGGADLVLQLFELHFGQDSAGDQDLAEGAAPALSAAGGGGLFREGFAQLERRDPMPLERKLSDQGVPTDLGTARCIPHVFLGGRIPLVDGSVEKWYCGGGGGSTGIGTGRNQPGRFLRLQWAMARTSTGVPSSSSIV